MRPSRGCVRFGRCSAALGSAPARPGSSAPAQAAASRSRRPSAACPCRRPPTLPPAGSGPVIYLIAPCFPAQGNVLDRRDRDLPVLHQAPAQPAVAGQSGCRTTTRPSRRCSPTSSALWATSFLDDLSIEVDRLHLPQRRHRQARDLPHGGARAGQDRRTTRAASRSTARRSTSSCASAASSCGSTRSSTTGTIRRDRDACCAR